MHSERFEVGAAAAAAIARARERGGRIVAVGTTSLRALESAALRGNEGDALRPACGETDLFITPGFSFRVVDLLLTNFHLPKSTLLMLVAAFAGHERIRALYAHAIAKRYRFFSYGDAMLLAREPGPSP
jgi:S-adenosylmethionine:tRNA ribosyltransferase-isomerase